MISSPTPDASRSLGTPGAAPRPGGAPAPSRRDVLRGAAGLALAPLVGGACAGRDAARPHVVVVLSDSHRASSTGCYGDRQVVTPHLDALAAAGVRCDTAVSTTPQCRPFRASFMTGAFPHRTGLVANRSPHNVAWRKGQWTPGDLPLLGVTFARAGYRCGYVGKWHLGESDPPPGPLRFGFDDAWFVAKGQAHVYGTWRYATGRPGEEVSGGDRLRSSVETDRALEILAAPGDRPWLLVVSYGLPHFGFDATTPFTRSRPVEPPPNVPPTAVAGRVDELTTYYAMIEALDAEVGRLVERIDAATPGRDVLLVYTSDHGEMLGSHGRQGKELPWSESTRVPLLLRWPGRLAAGRVENAPIGTPDLLPTLCGLAGIEAPAGTDGRDLSAVLAGRPGAVRPADAYLAAYDPHYVPWPGWRGLRTPSHLYARLEDRPWLLYDTAADPFELHNLVDEDVGLRDELDGRLARVMSELDDGWGA